MLRVGLTGGIACGKSHVLRRLADSGLDTLDLDHVAHAVMAPGGAAYDELLAAFGPRVLDSEGRIDRKALGMLVFAEADARARLNAIVHPRVRQEEARWAAAAHGPLLVTDGALLVEAGLHLRFDRLVVVHCSPAEQRRRLRERDRLDEASARARLAAQMPIEEKRRFAHFEVDTSGEFQDTNRATDALLRDLRALATARRPRVEVPRVRCLGGLLHGPAAGPRGLDPVTLLTEIASAGGLEMERIGRLSAPPCPGPWYRCASGPPDPAPGPATLALPVVLWALARGAPDPPFLVAAAASLARLTHLEPASLATAIVFGLALQETAVAGGLPENLRNRRATWHTLAERWGGGPPSASLDAVFDAALEHPRDPRAARAALGGQGERADLAGALVGLAAGESGETVPPPLLEAVDGLARLGGREWPAPGPPPG
jgi:dephospho-CoA kinase